MAALFFVFKNVPLVQKLALAVSVHCSGRSVHEVPEDMPVSHIDHDKHVVFCFIGIDECHSVTTIIVKDFPDFERSRKRIDGMSNIAFSGVWAFLNDVGQFVAHDCNVSNGCENSNGQNGLVDEAEVIEEDFEGALCVFSPFYFFYCG